MKSSCVTGTYRQYILFTKVPYFLQFAPDLLTNFCSIFYFQSHSSKYFMYCLRGFFCRYVCWFWICFHIFWKKPDFLRLWVLWIVLKAPLHQQFYRPSTVLTGVVEPVGTVGIHVLHIYVIGDSNKFLATLLLLLICFLSFLSN